MIINYLPTLTFEVPIDMTDISFTTTMKLEKRSHYPEIADFGKIIQIKFYLNELIYLIVTCHFIVLKFFFY